MAEPDAERRLLRSADGALACIGLYVGAVGPALVSIGRDMDVSLDTAGLVLTAMAGGSVLASGTIATRHAVQSYRRVAATGVLITAIGLLLLGLAPSFPLLLVAAALVGMGGGFADAGSHSLAASAASPDLAVGQLNRAFAVGAMLGPLWSGSVLALDGDLWIVFGGLALIAAGASAALWTASDRPGSQSSHGEPAGRAAARARLPAIVFLMSGLLFLYVGAEIGLGGWLASATRRATDAGVFVAGLVSSAYWGALWLGRAASVQALQRGLRSETILLLSIAGAGIGSLVLAAGGELIAIGALGAVLAGFSFGPIWPACLAIATRGAPPHAPSVMVTLGNGGGVVLPWVQGRVLVDAGPRAGMAVSALLCAGMLALAVPGVRRRSTVAVAPSPGPTRL